MEQEDEFDRKRADFADPPKQISNEGQKKAKALAKQGKNMVKSEEMLSPEQRRLKHELQAEALARLEAAAKTPSDFQRVTAWWDRLDANRERRERYHEVLRSGDALPLDHGSAEDGLAFPGYINHVLAGQIRKGDFIDAIFNCPYEIHELVTDAELSVILNSLKDEQKELLYLWAVRQYDPGKIAAIREQSERNIRKVRATMLKQIRKKLLVVLQEKISEKIPLTLEEKTFYEKAKNDSLDMR